MMIIMDSLSETVSPQLNAIFYECFGHSVSSQQQNSDRDSLSTPKNQSTSFHGDKNISFECTFYKYKSQFHEIMIMQFPWTETPNVKVSICLNFILFYVHVLCVSSAYKSVHHVCVWCLRRPKTDVKAPRIGTTDGCEPQWVLGIQLGPSGRACALGLWAPSRPKY